MTRGSLVLVLARRGTSFDVRDGYNDSSNRGAVSMLRETLDYDIIDDHSPCRVP